MEKLTFIYKITSPSGKIYIGSTFNIQNRISLYKTLNCKFQRKLYHSLLKYGWNNHIFEILEECTSINRNEKEYFWGVQFNVLGKKGLNCKLPKADEYFTCISEETRQKMSEWQIGRKMSNEAKKKMSDKAKGKIVSQETKIKISNYQSKPVLQFDLKNNFINEWKSAKAASNILNINRAHIGACCRKQRKTAGKFKWQFKNK